jgi:UDP-2,4-diacetamido-2,4,6-trideoxy-beta-L-altropyranose hydrolase
VKKRIFFRADGNSKIGLGHVIRSLSLAEMLREDFCTIFLIRSPSEDLRNKILNVCDELNELSEDSNHEEEASLVRNLINPEDILVLDGYSFDFSYQKILKLKSIKLVCIDDLAATHFLAEAIINHTPGIPHQKYDAEYNTRFYLGTEYAMLRIPFLRVAGESRQITNIESAFINFGGADPDNYTYQILKELISNNFLKTINVVVGSSYQYSEKLSELINAESTKKVKIFHSLNEHQLIDLMKQSQIAICAASTIAYEYCCVGGALFVIKTAENQSDSYKFLLKNNLAKDFKLDNLSNFNLHTVGEMINSQKRFFQGNSQKNIKAVFNQFLVEDQISVRKAVIDDMEIYFNWANDPVVRKNSINKEPIEWSNHEKWFKNKLSDTNSFLFVFSLKDDLIGQLRFDFIEQIWLISFSVDEKYRGKGLAEIIVYKSISELRKALDGHIKLKAQVQEDNVSSLKIFLHLGFKAIEDHKTIGFIYKTFIKDL